MNKEAHPATEGLCSRGTGGPSMRLYGVRDHCLLNWNRYTACVSKWRFIMTKSISDRPGAHDLLLFGGG